MALSADGSKLVAVKAGSNSVSVFTVGKDGGLSFVASAPSGGTDPISVTIYNDWLYVLNAGSTSPAVAKSVSAE